MLFLSKGFLLALQRGEKIFQRLTAEIGPWRGNSFMGQSTVAERCLSAALTPGSQCRVLGQWAKSVSTVLVRRLSGNVLTGSLCFRMTNCVMLQAVVFTLERTLLLFYLHKPADLLRIGKAERAFLASRICLSVLADFLLQPSECSVVCRWHKRVLDTKLC